MNWVVYELIDPLSLGLILRDYDQADYFNLLRANPVIEEGEAGYEAVLNLHRAGLRPVVKVIGQGLSEADAEKLAKLDSRPVLGLLTSMVDRQRPSWLAA